MKHTVAILLAVLGACLTAGARPPSSLRIPFAPTDPLRLPPNLRLGQVPGVAVNAQGDIFVYNRTPQTQLFEFRPDGTFLRTIGASFSGFRSAHSVKIDSEGNIWCVDEGSNSVVEFSPQGRVLMVLGREPEVSPAGAASVRRAVAFNRPTDVTWNPAGDIFVSDGYGNSRVVKFDPSGTFIKFWGRKGSAPGEFNLPHTIAADAQGNIYVGDRSNRRIQVFDSNGNFLRQITGIGAPWAICITPGPHQLLFTSDSAGTGRIYELDLAGRILGYFGKKGRQLGEFDQLHEIACPSRNTLFVADLQNHRVQKLTLHPSP